MWSTEKGLIKKQKLVSLSPSLKQCTVTRGIYIKSFAFDWTMKKGVGLFNGLPDLKLQGKTTDRARHVCLGQEEEREIERE